MIVYGVNVIVNKSIPSATNDSAKIVDDIPYIYPLFVLECNIFLQTAKLRHIIEFCQISVTQAKHVKKCLEEDLGRLSSAARTYIQSTLI